MVTDTLSRINMMKCFEISEMGFNPRVLQTIEKDYGKYHDTPGILKTIVLT